MATVLVIDDDLDIVDSIRDVLEDEGYTVVAAKDGEEALEKLAGDKPQLILLDLAMPHMDGNAFRVVQRQNPALASIPTVVMSAADRTPEKAAALAPDDTLVKPIKLATLLEVVARYCGPSRALGATAKQTSTTASED